MSPPICRIPVGDLHWYEAYGWQSRDRLDAIVAWPIAEIEGAQLGPHKNGRDR